jgi:signal transduction histidine kinase
MFHHFSLLIRNSFSPFLVVTLLVGLTIFPAPMQKRNHVLGYFLATLFLALFLDPSSWASQWQNRFILLFGIINVSIAKYYHFISRQRLKDRIEQDHQKLMESEKFKSIALMAGGLAHEFNSPLNVIQLNSELLLRQAERFQLNLQTVSKSVENIELSILKISKITSILRDLGNDRGGQSFKTQSISEIIEEVVGLLRERSNRYNVALNFISNARNDLVKASGTEISRAIIHLVNNSLDAASLMPIKTITIVVEESVEGWVSVKVNDSGKIAQEIVPQMMEPFFTTKAFGKAAGMGLKIAKALVENNDGRLEFNSEAPNTQFILHLPVVPQAAPSD